MVITGDRTQIDLPRRVSLGAGRCGASVGQIPEDQLQLFHLQRCGASSLGGGGY